MFDWITASPAERRLLPGGRLQGPTPYVIAIMMFVMVVIAAAGLALANGAKIVSRGVESRYSVQLTGKAADSEAVAAQLRSLPGIAAVRPVPADEMRRTLERWLGPAAAEADLPLPMLVDVDLQPGAKADEVGARIERLLPKARFTAHAETLGPVLNSLRAMTWLALALVLLVAAATVAAVVLATRGALDTNRSTIEIMHGVGASDDQIARLFQRRIALDALGGGAAGAAAAGLILALVAGGQALWIEDMAGAPLLTAGDVILLAALPLLAAALATVVARVAVRRALRASL